MSRHSMIEIKGRLLAGRALGSIVISASAIVRTATGPNDAARIECQAPGRSRCLPTDGTDTDARW